MTEEEKKAAEEAAKAAKAAEAETLAGQVNALFEGFFKDKMPELISEQVTEKMKELAENMKAAGDFNTNVKDDEFDSLETWEKCAKYYECVGKGDVSFFFEKGLIGGKKGLSEGVDSEGGFLVPEVVSNEIIRIAENFGLIRTLSRRVPMATDTFNQPTVESSVTTTWPGEKNAGTESNPVLGNRKMRAQTQVGISTVTNELLQDANQSIVGIINELFGEAFAGEEDEQGINGVGSPFTGIMIDSDVPAQVMGSGDVAFTAVTLQDLLELQSNLKDSVVKNGVYVMHRTVWALVLGIQEGSQSVIAIQNNTLPLLVRGERDDSITPVGFLHGKPVYASDKMPDTSASAVSTKFIYFGNHKKGFGFGDRQQMTMALSDSATVGSTNMFETNQQAVRFTERVALQVLLPNAFRTLATAAS